MCFEVYPLEGTTCQTGIKLGKLILPHHCSWRGSKITVVVNGEAATEEGEEGTLTKDELRMLRKKTADKSSYLQGSSIFLVGMPKSGKTTVGKCLSEALGYYFFDSQQLVEQAAGEQFSQTEEEQELRCPETEVLMQLSPLVRHMSSRNWGYLKRGDLCQLLPCLTPVASFA
ncbi:hypothetical protein R1sor_021434 [Riccia sorocarpa]|uniref:Uncharacterized protein n=1 Tax=Riccia sorocarpa TaxID=122646 RepID=A0ABD3GH24_9MARC